MEANKEKEYTCRVCGYLHSRPFYEEGAATSDICPCCGSESGYHDFTPDGVEMNRRRWIRKGAKWHADEWVEKGDKVDKTELKPENWSLEEQLRRIGVDLKDYQ